MKIYGFPLSPFVRKVLVAAQEKGVEVELVPTNPQQPDEAFIACSPSRSTIASRPIRSMRLMCASRLMRIVGQLRRAATYSMCVDLPVP